MTCSCQHSDPVLAAATEPFESQFPVPLYPPNTWFTEKPDWLAAADTKISVDDDGRVAGYFYNADQCLVHNHAACPRPSPTGYAAFHQQDVVLDDGQMLKVGVIGNVNGHASPYARVDAASEHYANPDRQLIACRAYDDEHGGYILGAMVPGKTYGDVALVRRSALSGDWRPMPPQWWSAHGVQASLVNECEGYDCIGPTLVTRPGLPLVRSYNDGQRAAAILGGVGGVQLSDDEEEIEIMAQTIELPDGTKITTPTEGRTAASPPPPPPPPAAKQAPPAAEDGGGDVEERLTALEEAMTQVVAKLNEMLQSQMAAMEASMAPLVALPPLEETG